MTFQFKIQLKGITKPPVWRRVTIPRGYSFFDFHVVIQIAFGWLNEHMFQFSPQGYGTYPQIKLKFDDDFDDRGFLYSGEILDAEELKVEKIFDSEGQKFTYIYDFGDSWLHTIVLEKISPERTMYPRILAGKGQCPPEDCGGAWGYEDLKEVLANPKSDDYQSVKEWLGQEEWDAKSFNIEESRQLLTEVFLKQ
ncbi:pRiA4b ORF-3-like protein [Mariniphaga anaerophila]|uniref:PRiA4b ORF-3-like protein n=1 Tax=Mariniphaga anaerophila TaxID=1484053 RepID=A0A1M4WQH9_9BACT|nr:plasmid pRiA4b ORF-3 family protein [Mariniphaga anaerophila]SHE83541.1 pRiA4b ORF-3-like protein [Mariniphaga anaerophila]